jgi:hypothetical protein
VFDKAYEYCLFRAAELADQHFFVTDSAEFDAFPIEVQEEVPQPFEAEAFEVPVEVEEEQQPLEIQLDENECDAAAAQDDMIEGFNGGIEEEIEVPEPSDNSNAPKSVKSSIPKSGVYYKDGQDCEKMLVANSARRVNIN